MSSSLSEVQTTNSNPIITRSQRVPPAVPSSAVLTPRGSALTAGTTPIPGGIGGDGGNKAPHSSSSSSSFSSPPSMSSSYSSSSPLRSFPPTPPTDSSRQRRQDFAGPAAGAGPPSYTASRRPEHRYHHHHHYQEEERNTSGRRLASEQDEGANHRRRPPRLGSSKDAEAREHFRTSGQRARHEWDQGKGSSESENEACSLSLQPRSHRDSPGSKGTLPSTKPSRRDDPPPYLEAVRHDDRHDLYVPSPTASKEDLPPPSLAVLQSSSGSEDEGFGSADDDGLLLRLQVLTSAPIIPPTPGGGDTPPRDPAVARISAGRVNNQTFGPTARTTAVSPATLSSSIRAAVQAVVPPSPSPPRPPIPPGAMKSGGREAGGTHRGFEDGGVGGTTRGSGDFGVPAVSRMGAARRRGRRQQERMRDSGGAGMGARRGSSNSSRGSSVGGGHFFKDTRLEDTLVLIRSGQSFCAERHITADFVKRANVPGLSKPQTRAAEGPLPDSEHLRHALLLTESALYMLEVEMLPRAGTASKTHLQHGSNTSSLRDNDQQQQQQQQPQHGHVYDDYSSLSISQDAAGYGAWPERVAAALVERPPRGVPAGVGGAGGDGGGSGSGRVEKAKVKSINTIDRLVAPELMGVWLPFREVMLKNGEVMARKGCGIVLHTKVEGRDGHVWLKCRSNQDRGALVDALVLWHESNTLDLPELNVQQIPETKLVSHLAKTTAKVRSDAGRRKDTDCVLS